VGTKESEKLRRARKKDEGDKRKLREREGLEEMGGYLKELKANGEKDERMEEKNQDGREGKGSRKGRRRIKERRKVNRRGTSQAMGYRKEHGRTESMYSAPQPVQERNCLLQSLGYTRNKDVLNRVLNLALSDSVMCRSGTACFSPWATPGSRMCLTGCSTWHSLIV
jgi:hypothetical protein